MPREDRQEAISRLKRNLSAMREVPGSSTTTSTKGDHFSFPIPGKRLRNMTMDKARAGRTVAHTISIVRPGARSSSD